MTTVGLPDTSTYATVELASCLVMPSARAYGSEGWGFESLGARSGRIHAHPSAAPIDWSRRKYEGVTASDREIFEWSRLDRRPYLPVALAPKNRDDT
jgi:hypothetical protein